MKYMKISQFDTANGPGIRTVLWTAGCLHHCHGCHNPDTWNPSNGIEYTEEVADTIIDTLSPYYISGLTISGGDPLYFMNISPLSRLVQRIKNEYPNKSIWLYTGYSYEDILDEMKYDKQFKSLIDHIDVLVDGRYEEDKRDISLPYCGSSNQRVIDMKKSSGSHIVLYQG